MKRKIAFIISVLLVFLVALPQVFSANGESEGLEIFHATTVINLNDQFSLNPNVYFYGKENDYELEIQYGGGEFSIPIESVQKAEFSDTEKPSYQTLPPEGSYALKTIDEGDTVYSTNSSPEHKLDIISSSEYPVYQDENGENVIYIGNTAFFYEEKEDIVMTEDDSSKTTGGETETTTTEEQLTSEDPEEPKQDSEEPAVSGEEGTEEPTIDSNEELNTEVSESEGEKEVQSETEQTVLVQATANSTDPWDGVISDYFKVTTTTTVYDNRGSGSLRPMGQLKQGQVYPRVSDYGNWHRIEFGGIYGYVRKSDTVPDDGGSLQNENGNYTNQSRTFETLKDVTVYDNTSGSLVPFGQISKGEQYALAGDYGKWWRVLFSDRIGYVRKEEVKAETKPTDNYFRVYHADIPVYDNRSGSLKKVGELEKGQSYSIVRDYGNWWRIQFGDFYGYVRKSDTGYATESEIPNMNKNHTNTAHKLETKQQVEVYDNTSGSLVPFGKIDKGQLFPIAADYGNWWRILYLDRVGYVRKNEANVQYADFADYFKAEEDLPVYDNRSSDSLKKVGEVEKDQVYTRVSDYGNWHRIQFGDFYGYVEKFATSPATGEAVKNKNDGYSNQNRTFETLEDVTVYDNASGSLKPFGKIEKGERFPIATDYGNWWRVLFTDRVGYINKDLVKAEFQSGDNYFRVHKDNLAVYDNQSGYLKKIGELTKGQVYPISNNYGNWWHVDFGGSNGYVHKNDTGFATGKEIKNLNMNYSNSGKKFLVSQNTPVYDNTSGNLVPFGELERGTVFPITTDYGNWWRIIYLDRIGYVKKSDLLDFEAQDLEKLVVEYQHKDTSATVDRIKSFFINPNRNYVTSSNNILNGFYQISSYGTFDFSKGIHWGESPVKGEELSRSYYRALHANFFLNDLIAAYKENGNEEYIIKGFESIKDWVEKNPYQDPAHSMSWHDEASARRLVTWVNFFDSAKTVLNEEQLQFLLENMIEHADILLSNDFHTTNTNHGMFQDEALLVFSDYFNSLPKSQIYSEVGEERLESYFNFIISEEGVHLEHSPGYHQTIASSVKRYRDFFSLMGDSNQYNYYNSLYHLMANYYIWLIKPDGTLPLIGDTFSNVTPPTSLWKENQHYLYVLSQGKQGVKPGEHSVVFEDAGYAIFRDDWEKGDHATYIHFTAAYHTDYHKHSDDLSVWIYANGHDIISEAGPNGYDYDLPLTQFGYSSYAHNTLIVNDKGLPRTDGKYDKTHLVDYSLDDDISSVSGVNKRYEGVEHKRNLTYDRTLNEIRVKDSITSDDENNYKIIWNLAEGVTPRIEGNIIKLFIGEEEIGTLQINSNSEVTIEDIKGQKEPDLLGWHLNGTSNPIETHAIIIEAIDTNSEIESVFSLSQ